MQGVSRMRESKEVVLARMYERKQKVLDCFDFVIPKCAKDLKDVLDIPWGTLRIYIYDLDQMGYLKLHHWDAQKKYFIKTEEIIVVPEYNGYQKPEKEKWNFIPYKIEHLAIDIPVPDYAKTKVKERHTHRNRTASPKVYVGSTANML